MIRKGICNNFGNCPNKADLRSVIEVPEDKEFVCPDCGGPLIPLEEWNKKKGKKFFFPLLFIALVLPGIILVLGSHFLGSKEQKKGMGLATSQRQILFILSGEDRLVESLVRPLVLGFLNDVVKGKNPEWFEHNPKESEGGCELPGGKAKGLIKIFTESPNSGFMRMASMKEPVGLFCCRKVTPEELKRFPFDMTSSDHEYVIGQSGLVVFVSGQNPIDSLSLDQLQKIFSGQLTDWKELTQGFKGKIMPVVPAEKSFCGWQNFANLFGGGLQQNGKEPKAIPGDEFNKRISKDPGILGIVDFSRLSATGSSVKILSLYMKGAVAFKPTPLNIGTEAYPLSYRIYFYVFPNGSSTWIQAFIQYILSDAGQKVVSSRGFVGSGIKEERSLVNCSQPSNESIPAGASTRYRTLVKDSTRVPFDIRFRFGTAELDNKGMVDIQRLAQFLSEAENRDKGVLLIGFTDNVGSHTYNLGLSLERAQSVAKVLESRGITVVNVAGAGEEMPVASNESEEGREKNRRVEVWLCPKKK
ncbi:OmpA family protein [Candidatus Methylacidiphilum infernorum]|uniref:OmpA family protein n=1 Tax=Candidatus Methylacidiphilum infernorum TaxID=511746 RepID=A0ABX7PVR9_9BACT|nr:phosphate ABC transporter substrate-binding/OmpA family protein [Candidatus Methylacidiphilum infernorum]QSR87094.1 OmpA family protein [Candidatus Methylacidiphilum infernorum]